MQDWDADMDVRNDVEDDNLAEDFDRALSETISNKDEDDREVSDLRASDLLVWRTISHSTSQCNFLLLDMNYLNLWLAQAL